MGVFTKEQWAKWNMERMQSEMNDFLKLNQDVFKI